MAYGIAIAGAGLGVPPMTWAINQLIAHYDWRITMRILAGMSLLMCVSSLSYSRLENKQEQRIQLQKRDRPRSLNIGVLYKIKLRLLELLSLNPWKNKAFAVWAVSLSFIAFGNFIPFVFLVSIFSLVYFWLINIYRSYVYQLHFRLRSFALFVSNNMPNQTVIALTRTEENQRSC